MALQLFLSLAMAMAAGGEVTVGVRQAKISQALGASTRACRGCAHKPAEAARACSMCSPMTAAKQRGTLEDAFIPSTGMAETNMFKHESLLSSSALRPAASKGCMRLIGGGEEKSLKLKGSTPEGAEAEESFCGLEALVRRLFRWIKEKVLHKNQDMDEVQEHPKRWRTWALGRNVLLSTTSMLALRSVFRSPSIGSPSHQQLVSKHEREAELKQSKRTFLENCVRSRELMERALEDGRVEFSPRYISSFGIITGMLWASVCGEIFSSLLPGRGGEEEGGGE
eukprot:418079-Hanusia_phi.AAC.1